MAQNMYPLVAIYQNIYYPKGDVSFSLLITFILPLAENP